MSDLDDLLAKLLKELTGIGVATDNPELCCTMLRLAHNNVLAIRSHREAAQMTLDGIRKIISGDE